MTNSSLTPEAIYFELDRLVAALPDLAHGPITPEMNLWLGQTATLVKMMGDTLETVHFRVASENLDGVMREGNARKIIAVVNRALAKARLAAPAFQGEFIEAGHGYDAFTAVGKILRAAKADAFMVDPHADEKVLDDFAQLAPDKVVVRLLTKTNYKQSLGTAAERWIRQHGKGRPLEVRLLPADKLHNRLIMVDGKTAWELGQSFNGLGERSHMSVLPVPPQLAAREVAAYQELWASAMSL